MIAFNSISQQTSGSYTVPTGNPIVFVGCRGSIGSDSISGVTLGGTAMTLVDKLLNPGTNGRYCYLFVLQAPSTGSQTLSISGTVADAWVISYTGAKQTGQVDSHGTTSNGDGSTTLSKTLTSSADNCWMLAFCDTANGNPLSAGTNTTKRGTDAVTFFDSDGAISPAGSRTLQITSSGSAMVMLAATFLPDGTVAAGTSFMGAEF